MNNNDELKTNMNTEILDIRNYYPISKLETTKTVINKPKFPVIDAHNHLGTTFGGNWIHKPLEDLIAVMDQAGIVSMVDLDGFEGESVFQDHLKKIKEKAPDRFRIYTGPDYSKWEEEKDNFGEYAAKKLQQQIRQGAQGLKIWKNLGAHVRDHRGARVRLCDPRLDPLWHMAAEYHLPVTIHFADPVAFYDPLDEKNERWEELHAHPEWHFPSPPFPSFQQLYDDFLSLLQRNPDTLFIGAHVGCYAENLSAVEKTLREFPNYYIDISERIAELGRQPYTAREFMIKNADRIVFGLDRPANISEYRCYYRFLESKDEYFDYSEEEIYRQGRWKIYGIFLPDDVLEKIYYKNAEKILVPN